MWVFPAKNRINADNRPLKLQRIQVMRHSHQIRLRWEPVVGVIPISSGENTELPRVQHAPNSVPNLGKLCLCVALPGGINRFSKFNRLSRIRIRSAHHVDPVQGMQMIKMHHVVVDFLGGHHEVADQLGLFRRIGPNGILHSRHRCHRMRSSTHAANTANKSPHIPGIPPLNNGFNAAELCGFAPGVFNLIVVAFQLDA